MEKAPPQQTPGHDRESGSVLLGRARQAMIDAGFEPDFPAGTGDELVLASARSMGATQPRDLQHLLWTSIDNEASRDLDQVEYVEQKDGETHLLLGIADVEWRIARDSLIEAHAAANTTSVYTGVTVFPMLPERLSNDLSSLLEGQTRLALVVELVFKPPSEVRLDGIYSALIRNHHKLSYTWVGNWLEGKGGPPSVIAGAPGLEQQLQWQFALAKELYAARRGQGALNFARLEAQPVVRNGRVVDLQVVPHNPARQIIESFMVTANIALASFLTERGAPAIKRIVREPKRWDRIRELAQREGKSLPQRPDSRALSRFLESARRADPSGFPELSLAVLKLLGRGEYGVHHPGGVGEGHFGLAISNYTHATAPNRRYVDFVTQRLLKAAMSGMSQPYGKETLDRIAVRCTEREKAADKVERLMRKVAAADLMAGRVGEIFPAIVTGASAKGTWVRLIPWPAEGKVVRREQGLDVGDRVEVRLVAVDRDRGFIDFERVR